jgi:hypothetical protein
MKNFMLLLVVLVSVFTLKSKVIALDYDDYSSGDNAYSSDTGYATGVSADDSSSYFYDSLSPYGTWETDADYGRVWVPRESYSDPNWRPYVTGGHWVSTDAGWFWDSSYDWGWAPYHYGRWGYRSHHWYWVPGSVWGPSWVSWRYSGDYYGWAPLPPAAIFVPGVGFSYYGRNIGFNAGFDFGLGFGFYSFVPGRSFLSLNLGVALVPSFRSGAIYRSSSLYNSYGYRNGAFVNSGIPVRNIERSTGSRITPVQVSGTQFRAGTAARVTRQGNTIVAPRAAISANAAARGDVRAARQSANIQRQNQRAVQQRERATTRQNVRQTRQTERAAQQRAATAQRQERAATRQRDQAARQTQQRERAAARQNVRATRQSERAAQQRARADQQRERAATRSQERAARQRATPATPATPARPRGQTDMRTTPATPATPATPSSRASERALSTPSRSVERTPSAPRSEGAVRSEAAHERAATHEPAAGGANGKHEEK